MKRCSKCGEEKPLDAFNASRRNKDGRQSACRTCQSAHYRANQEQYRANQAAWRKANPGRNAELARRWRQANPERAAALVRAWNEAHPKEVQERYARRRARKRNATVENFTLDDLLASWAARGIDPDRCVYCSDGAFEHVDHVVPLARGGSHALENLAPACARCNCSKGAKLLDEWLSEHQARLSVKSAA